MSKTDKQTFSVYSLFIKHQMHILRKRNPTIHDERRFLIKASDIWNSIPYERIKYLRSILENIKLDNSNITQDELAVKLYSYAMNKKEDFQS